MIEIVVGDLAEQRAEAVVRAIRSDLSPVNALSRDLARAAGEPMEERLQRLGAIPLGGAVMTPAGDLPADFVIHVVVMSDEEPQSAMTVQRGLRNALRRAADWGLESLALPALGLGAGTLEAESAARALLEILFDHLEQGEKPLALKVVVATEYEGGLFRRLVDELSRER